MCIEKGKLIKENKEQPEDTVNQKRHRISVWLRGWQQKLRSSRIWVKN